MRVTHVLCMQMACDVHCWNKYLWRKKERKRERESESEEKGDNHAWLIIAVLCCCSGDVSNLGKAERPMRPVIGKAYYFKCYSKRINNQGLAYSACCFKGNVARHINDISIDSMDTWLWHNGFTMDNQRSVRDCGEKAQLLLLLEESCITLVFLTLDTQWAY